MKLFPNTSIINAPFSSMFDVIKDKGIKPTHILLDLGVSSFQIDDSNRGFTFQRMNPWICEWMFQINILLKMY